MPSLIIIMEKHQQVIMTCWCCCGLHGQGRSGKRHQRVLKTCWCWLQPAWSREKWGKAPTSHYNLLVLCVASMVNGEVKKTTNES